MITGRLQILTRASRQTVWVARVFSYGAPFGLRFMWTIGGVKRANGTVFFEWPPYEISVSKLGVRATRHQHFLELSSCQFGTAYGQNEPPLAYLGRGISLTR